MKKIILFCWPFLLLLTGCERFFSQVVEIDPPAYEKQLVFHFTVTDQDTVLRLTLTRNLGILETANNGYESYFVKNATVTCWKEGQQLLQLQSLGADSAHIYTAVLPNRVKPGERYEIRVEHPDFKSVSAVQVMPESANVVSTDVETDLVPDQFGNTITAIDMDLADPANQRDYYEISLLETFKSISCYTSGGVEYCDTFSFSNIVQFEQFNDAAILEGPDGTLLINDQFFDGKTYLFRERYPSYFQSNDESRLTHTLIVRKVTEDYFRWARSYAQNLNAQDNPLAEPVILYTNVLNGLGIFGLLSEQRFELQ